MTSKEVILDQAAKLVLRKAAVLLKPPEAWTKGRMARDRFREPVPPMSSRATCWCASGAIRVNAWGDSLELFQIRRRAYQLLGEAAGDMSIINWNDAPERTHAEVLAAFERAAA